MITVYYKKVFPLQEEDTFSQINLSLDRDMTAHSVMKKLDKRRRERISRIKNEKARAREITAGGASPRRAVPSDGSFAVGYAALFLLIRGKR